ncbi:MAG: hypothetical protein CXT78_07350 [Thaumarchaeota archaeon]|mgnify:FL=1|nr:MAG: hypothetical protein CXT78_07350 [Nitrososphaerota archaeon]
MKTNFKKEENIISKINEKEITDSEGEDLTQKEFEEYIAKSGAKGSFMVYRSNNKDDELGLDEI